MNGWKKLSILLMIVILILIGDLFYSSYKDGEKLKTENLCEVINGTPAWVKDGVVFSYGYKEYTEGIVNDLIQEKVYFLYSSQCGWCKKQIEDFGEDWQKYVDSELTIDCYK